MENMVYIFTIFLRITLLVNKTVGRLMLMTKKIIITQPNINHTLSTQIQPLAKPNAITKRTITIGNMISSKAISLLMLAFGCTFNTSKSLRATWIHIDDLLALMQKIASLVSSSTCGLSFTKEANDLFLFCWYVKYLDVNGP